MENRRLLKRSMVAREHQESEVYDQEFKVILIKAVVWIFWGFFLDFIFKSFILYWGKLNYCTSNEEKML